jgi:hypothetical protein
MLKPFGSQPTAQRRTAPKAIRKMALPMYMSFQTSVLFETTPGALTPPAPTPSASAQYQRRHHYDQDDQPQIHLTSPPALSRSAPLLSARNTSGIPKDAGDSRSFSTHRCLLVRITKPILSLAAERQTEDVRGRRPYGGGSLVLGA